MGMRMSETCWAVFKRQVINLRSYCIWLAGSVESMMMQAGSADSMMMHGLANPKFKKFNNESCFFFKSRPFACCHNLCNWLGQAACFISYFMSNMFWTEILTLFWLRFLSWLHVDRGFNFFLREVQKPLNLYLLYNDQLQISSTKIIFFRWFLLFLSQYDSLHFSFKESNFNLLKPTGHMMHQQVYYSGIVCSGQIIFMCFVFIWEQTANGATYSINWLVFITEIKSVYSAVRI